MAYLIVIVILHFIAVKVLTDEMQKHDKKLWLSYGSPSLQNSHVILSLYHYVFTGKFFNNSSIGIKLSGLALVLTTLANRHGFTPLIYLDFKIPPHLS